MAAKDLLERFCLSLIRGLERLDRVFKRAERTPDKRLIQRVRGAIGRATGRPVTIRVLAHNGTVTLAGTIWSFEEERLLEAVRSVRGVRKIITHFDVRERRQEREEHEQRQL